MSLQVIQIVITAASLYLLFIFVMSFALLVQVGSIRKRHGYRDWRMMVIVDRRTGDERTMEDIITVFRKNCRGLAATVGLLSMALYYSKQNPAAVNLNYAAIFVAILVIFGGIWSYSNIMNSGLLLKNIVNRHR